MKSYVDDELRARWAEHKLVPMNVTGEVTGYRLKHPDSGRVQGCMILFTPEGIVVCGDWCPNNNHGVVSNLGYGVEWFGNTLSEGYLCSKFLRTEYSRRAAREAVVERLKDLKETLAERGALRDDVRQLWEARIEAYEIALEEDDGESIDCEHFGTEERYYALIQEANDWDEVVDGSPHDYDDRDAGLLCVIQHRFSELWTTGRVTL